MFGNTQIAPGCKCDTFELSGPRCARHWRWRLALMHHRNMATPEEIQVARAKAEATRLRNLLKKQAEYSVLSWKDARVLKRLMDKKTWRIGTLRNPFNSGQERARVANRLKSRAVNGRRRDSLQKKA